MLCIPTEILSDATLSLAEKIVLAYAVQHSGTTASEISRATGISYRHVSRAVHALSGACRLERERSGQSFRLSIPDTKSGKPDKKSGKECDTRSGIPDIRSSKPDTMSGNQADEASGGDYRGGVPVQTVPVPETITPPFVFPPTVSQTSLATPTDCEVTASNGAKRKRRSRLPESFQPNRRNRERAFSSGIDIDRELEKFTAYHEAKGSLMADWQAAFRTWLLNVESFRRTPIQKPTTTQAVGPKLLRVMASPGG